MTAQIKRLKQKTNKQNANKVHRTIKSYIYRLKCFTFNQSILLTPKALQWNYNSTM